jgi:predicted nucleic acid-binding protein
MIVLLDSGVLGLLVHPIQRELKEDNKKITEISQCTKWFYSLSARSVYFVTSEVSDYEIRRELIRIQSSGIEILDNLRLDSIIDFLPVNTQVWEKASQLWAKMRQERIATASDRNIDADMIIAAQWQILCEENQGQGIYIATTNLKHLQRIAGKYALEWQDIRF